MAGLSKYVQEMSIDGDEPPPRFILKEPVNLSPPPAPIPVIDFSLLSSSPSNVNELQKLKSALTDWGCFQILGHNVPSSFLDKLRGVTKQFFALPTDEKVKYGRREANDIEGYGNDPVFSEKQILDWSDRLFLRVAPVKCRKPELWPDDPPEFRETLEEYLEKTKAMAQLLLKAMAKSLNLEENCFLKQKGEEEFMTARFNYYPSCRRPDSVLGVKAHSDGSFVTFLLQDDEVEGLQTFRNSQWFKVPIVPHALLVNLGDQMQIMSNGIFKSPRHRVSGNSEKERISIAVFYLPDPELEIEPVRQLIDEERPQVYKRIKNYAAFNFQCVQTGKVALNIIKLSH